MSKKTVVVTGGAGYLGGAACVRLIKKGYRPLSLERRPTPKNANWESIVVDLADAETTRRVWDSLPEVSAVLHFAALALVAESVEFPEKYRHNNVQASLNCAQEAARHGVGAFVHSSSCAVYGHPKIQPITELSSFSPISPYGESKQLSETALNEVSRRTGLKTLNLRYFNPAGALDSLSWGERHEPETHLIPLMLRSARTGNPVSIFGSDYPTPDGTCIRDFVHVEDLIDAHILALEKLEAGADLPVALNLGAGQGVSVREVLKAAERITGKTIQASLQPRRPGDPPMLVADASNAARYLGWKPSRPLDAILLSQWAWETESSAS